MGGERCKRKPAPVAKPGCGELMALLHRAPNPFIEKLTARERRRRRAVGVQLAAGFSRDHAPRLRHARRSATPPL
jgi:hypothetical protein